MKFKTILLAILLGVLLLAQYTPPHTNPGPAAERIVGKLIPIAQAAFGNVAFLYSQQYWNHVQTIFE
jgi:hypothetical protein